MTTIPVTVVVPVKNEARNIARCLASLSRFSEVIVVDSGSMDGTPEIALRFNVKLLQFAWNGKCPKKRNWVLLNCTLANEWVLFLDADELLDDRFCDEVSSAVASCRCNGYWLNYTNYFLGRKLRHGVPQRKLALFKAAHGLYEMIDELPHGNLDMEIHEHPVIEGPVGEIRALVTHNDDYGLERFLDRHRDYAIWEAQRLLLLEQKREPGSTRFTRRQRFKYSNMQKSWYPWAYFVYAFVLRRGFLDGFGGFYYATYKSWYFLTVRLFLAELRGGTVSANPTRPVQVSSRGEGLG